MIVHQLRVIFCVTLCLFILAFGDRCHREMPIPNNLNLLPEYGLAHEVHHHGVHRIDLSNATEIAFSVFSDSYFRAYMSPHKVDIDLYLYKGGVQVDISFSAFREEIIAKTLSPGEYSLKLRPLGYSSLVASGEISVLDCQWVMLEIAIVPVDVVQARIRSYTDCPVSQLLPTVLDFSPLDAGQPFHFDTTDNKVLSRKYNIKPIIQNTTSVWTTTYISNFSFVLDPAPGTNPLFKFRATLGYDFITGGSLRLALIAGVGTDPTSCDYFMSDCKFGVNLAPNTHTLQTTLGPGNYSLWILDRPGRRLDNITSCSPISIQLDIEQEDTQENFLSCHVERIPTDLNLPGFIDDTGYLYFREKVFIDLSTKVHQSNLSVRAPSLFKVWVEPHRIDIDLDLHDETGKSLARTVQSSGKAESIVFELQPNKQYTLMYKYYTSLDAFFCESFELEISIIPLTSDYQVNSCTGKTTALPVLDGLQSLSSAFHLPKQLYYFVYTNSTKSRAEQLIRVPVNTTTDMRLSLHIGALSYTGLTATLTKLGGGPVGNSSTEAISEYNGVRMTALISAGQQYYFTLQTGPFQLATSSQQFPLSPSCVFFEFELHLEPSLFVSTACDTVSIPSDLSGPQYLGSSNRVHFQDRFLLPSRSSGFDAEETMTFTVRNFSQVRAYTDSKLDGGLMFSITENGVPLNSSISRNNENQQVEATLYAIVSPGKIYAFTVKYFNFQFRNLTRCSTWNFEFEIAPIPAGIQTEVCTQDKVPPTSINVFATQYESTEQYAFSQNSTQYSASIQFVVWNFVYFRSLVFYDFVWGDLTLQLYRDNDTLIVEGENDYNKNEIQGTRLASGSYTLVIRETLPQIRPELRRCIEYTLQIGMTPITSNTAVPKPQDFTGCPYLSIPPTFDTIAYLSEMNGNKLHFSNTFRMDLKSRGSKTVFHVVTPSYLRLFVPPHDVDVDVYLYSVNPDTDAVSLITSSFGYNEEVIFQRLEVGLYQIRFSFLPNFQKGIPYPDPDACMVFSVELSIAPIAWVNSHLLLPSSPAPIESQIPDSLNVRLPLTQTFTRKTSSFNHTLGFSIFVDSLFRASVAYPFITGGLYFTLEGTFIMSPFLSSPPNRTWSGVLGQGFAFFDLVLYPGDYSLVLTDKTNYNTTSFTQFLLQYTVDAGVVPENYCDDADKLPTDLYTKQGGSQHYGGLQSSTGAVRISGSHFLVPDVNTHNNVLFKIMSPSYVRFWAATPGDNNDIDFMLWRNASKKELVAAAVGLEAAESQLTLLQPQADPYLLDVYIFQRTKVQCSYATFEFVVEPNISALSRLSCPSPLPNPQLPPATIIVDRNTDFFSTDFVFTYDFVQNHTEKHWSFNLTTYSINITVNDGNYFLMAMIGFDFTLTDFSLSLLRDGRTPVGQVSGQPPFFVDSFVSFQSWVSADVTPGNYVLKITEKFFKARSIIPGQCDRFSLMFVTVYESPSNSTTPAPGGIPPPATQPHIISVVPPAGAQLDASLPLTVQITFSQSVNSTIPSGYDTLRSWLRNNSVVYLEDQSTGFPPPANYIWPQSTFFNSARNQLTVMFIAVSFGHNYKLHINATKVPTANGDYFASYSTWHVYSMLSCECGGHGSCSPNASHVRECYCDFPYTGPECKSCMQGYYRAGTQCLQNIKCTPSSCNDHGICDDSKGFPQCQCNVGYASNDSAPCGQCHVGFEGYPNCTKKVDDRKTRCTAPLLPTDLNAVSYLHFPPARETFHLQGEFFADLTHIEHDMTFTLTENSYFRVYTEPHTVDIDLWLWRLSPTDNDPSSKTLIATGITYNEEETFFMHLEGGNQYLLAIHFIPTVKSVGDCPTFNLELAISTDALFHAEVNQFTPDCPASTSTRTDALPQVVIPGNVVPESGYIYNPDQQFAVGALSTITSPRKFQNISFSIPKVPGKVGLINLELGYRFLVADIAVKLLRNDLNNTVVATGFNSYNKHILDHLLQPGNYTIMLYLPIDLDRTLTPCAPFTFQLQISFTDETANIFNCNYPRLPSSLSLAPYDGRRVHIFDSFIVGDQFEDMEFTLTEPSYVRLAASSSTTTFLVVLASKVNSIVWTTIELSSSNGEISSSLGTGTYRFSFITAITFSPIGTSESCSTIDVELAIMPKSDLGGLISSVVCPVGSISVLPQLPATIATLPYYFSSQQEIFYAFPAFGTTVAEYTFQIFENVVLDVGIASHFLTGNLKPTITKTEGRLSTLSTSAQEDYNYIHQELSPGSYTLSLTLDAPLPWDSAQAGSPPPRLACTPFTFSFSLIPVATFKADPCWEFNLAPVPKSLNSLRYMSALEDSVTLQSSKWQIPPLVLNHATLLTNFTIKSESLFRIYVAENAIDIDVHLHKVVNGTQQEIATGSNQFGEESFVNIIPPGTYYIRFEFYNWGSSQPFCPKFSMQLAIVPMNVLPPIQERCPSSAVELWPTIPTSLDQMPFSVPIESDYHYQQTDQSGFSRPIFFKSFTLPYAKGASFNAHFELGYNFWTTNLVIKLENTLSSGITQRFYGQGEFHRNVLSVKNIPSGVYNLTFYEAAPNTNPRLVGCSHFTFYMFVDRTTSSVQKTSNANILDLPSSLDTVSFLKYSPTVHFAGYFTVLRDTPAHRQSFINFTLQTQSLVRVGVPIDGTLAVDFKDSEPHAFPSLVSLLNPGRYAINFFLQDALISESVSSYVEIEISPLTSLQKLVDQNLRCKNKLATNPSDKWAPPQITIRPDNGYMFRDKNAFLTQQQILSADMQYFVMPVTVTVDSVISVQLQYDFVLTPLTVTLSKDWPIREPTRFATSRYNLADLNVQVKPGTYNISIVNTRPWSLDNKNGLLGKDGSNNKELPCVDFDLMISVSALGSDDDRVDCSAYSLFPFDLNSETGGSFGFGGPIKYGSMKLWHDKFLLNDNVRTMRASFRLENDSMVSVFMTQHSWTNLITTIHSAVNSTLVYPVDSTTDWYQYAGIYNMPAGNYYVELEYTPSIFETCSYFSFGMAVQLVQDVVEDLTQACNSVQPALPPHVVSNIYQTQGYFKMKDILDNTNKTTHIFSYNINFTIPEGTSYLDVAFSYNSLASFFTLKLYTLYGPTNSWVDMFSGQWAAVKEESSYLGLTQVMEYTPHAATYQLSILHSLSTDNELPVFNGRSSSGVEACFPFLLDIQISASSGGTVVRSVQPRGGPGYDPSSDIYIEIRFSTPLFTASKDPITRSENTELLSKSVVLKNSTKGAPSASSDPSDIPAAQVTFPPNNPHPDDYTRWLFIFSHEHFKFGTSYELALLSGSFPLYGPDSRVVSMPERHKYEMKVFDITCTGAGTYNATSQQCNCNAQSHRTGLQCERCEPGYQIDDNNLCVPQPVCSVDTCGCLPQTDTTKPCTPIGDCSLIPTRTGSLKIRCDCKFPQYTGNKCDTCAVGYYNYPTCSSSECAPGSDCENKYEWLKITGLLVAVLLVLGLGATGLWWFKFRKPPSAFVDETLELELAGGRRVAGGGPDPLAGLTDEEENISDDLVADAHDSDEDKPKEPLISLEDYETAHKASQNVNLLG